MSVEFVIIWVILVLGLVACTFGKGVGFFGGLVIVFFSCLLGEIISTKVVKEPCEVSLPRDESCVIVAIPEDKVESVRELLND